VQCTLVGMAANRIVYPWLVAAVVLVVVILVVGRGRGTHGGTMVTVPASTSPTAATTGGPGADAVQHYLVFADAARSRLAGRAVADVHGSDFSDGRGACVYGGRIATSCGGVRDVAGRIGV
jgi:hypothetical protein